jgi:hypothetical protein
MRTEDINKMDAKKRAFVSAIILTIAALIISGCGGEVVETATCPYWSGSEGVHAEFEEIGINDAGMTEVWEDESFPVSVMLNNRGEFTIPAHALLLEIKGVSPGDFSGLDFTRTNDEELEKRSEFLPQGGETWVSFGDATYVGLRGNFYNANFQIYYTYPYETYIQVPQVCYKADNRETEVCRVNAVKQACASGGPIQVGTVTEKYYGRGKIALEIPIYNIGTGKAVASEYDEFRPEWDEIGFQVDGSDSADWECTARGNPAIARINYPGGTRNHERVVILCRNEYLEYDALYTKAFHMTLRYWYKDWIHKNVMIKSAADS